MSESSRTVRPTGRSQSVAMISKPSVVITDDDDDRIRNILPVYETLDLFAGTSGNGYVLDYYRRSSGGASDGAGNQKRGRRQSILNLIANSFPRRGSSHRSSRSPSPEFGYEGSPIHLTVGGTILDGGLGASSNNNNNNNNEEESNNRKCCNETHQKLLWGVFLCICVAMSWVGATHFIKYLYVYDSKAHQASAEYEKGETVFNAPFFTTWFSTVWTGLFFPFYLCAKSFWCTSHPSIKEMYHDSVALFHAKGFTFGKFLSRCAFFTVLWVITNYMYIHSLGILGTTDIIALYASNVSFVYLLSWVVLHEQFVGIRIVAVILCDTGIALLAYMDGINKTKTLSGVVLAAASAAGSAVYKVLFRKVLGDVSVGQVSAFFTIISIFNTFLLWPIMLTLLLTGVEIVKWNQVPWFHLMGAVFLLLVSNLLGTFGVSLTYETFITLGLMVAIPVSAALDINWYHTEFEGMKLSGIILIGVGFILVLMPENWPDYLTKVLHWRWRKNDKLEQNRNDRRSSHSYLDSSYGGYRSRLRSPSSGLVR